MAQRPIYSSFLECVVDNAPQPKRPKVSGMGRMGDNDKALLLMLNWRPTDDQLRYLHEVMERAVACMPDDLR